LHGLGLLGLGSLARGLGLAGRGLPIGLGLGLGLGLGIGLGLRARLRSRLWLGSLGLAVALVTLIALIRLVRLGSLGDLGHLGLVLGGLLGRSLGGLGLGWLGRRGLTALLVIAGAHCILSIMGSARNTTRTVRPVWRTISSIPTAPFAIASCTCFAIGSITSGAR